MLSNNTNLTNQRFGRLIVLYRVKKDKFNRIIWKCICDCGNYHEVAGTNLRRGIVKSCGCLGRENNINCNRDGKMTTKHGGVKNYPKEYEVYRNMKSRILNKNNISYKYYGGRGIKICDRWLEPNGQGFKNFLEDMGPKPGPEYTLERVNNDGDYEPSNCIWADRKTQNRNSRNSKLNITQVQEIRNKYWSCVYTLKELADEYSVSIPNIHDIVTGKIWN